MGWAKPLRSNTMSSTFPSSTPFVPDARQDHAAPKLSKPKRSLLNRMWHILLEAGQRRAVAEMARHVRLHGGRPTGNLAQDAQRVAALRGWQ
jgi:hypothetical protein